MLPIHSRVRGPVTPLMLIIYNRLLSLLSIIKVRSLRTRAQREIADIFKAELDTVNRQA